MLAWGDQQLAHAGVSKITVGAILIASSRCAKAALTLAIHRDGRTATRNLGKAGPMLAFGSLDAGINRTHQIADILEHEPSGILWQLIPKHETHEQALPPFSTGHWDVFISHAGEDKKDLVRPLAGALRARGLSVWFDELTLTVGDSLRRSIDRGLARFRFGVVVTSPHFLDVSGRIGVVEPQKRGQHHRNRERKSLQAFRAARDRGAAGCAQGRAVPIGVSLRRDLSGHHVGGSCVKKCGTAASRIW